MSSYLQDRADILRQCEQSIDNRIAILYIIIGVIVLITVSACILWGLTLWPVFISLIALVYITKIVMKIGELVADRKYLQNQLAITILEMQQEDK